MEGTEKRSQQICLKTVQNVHNVSLTGYCEQGWVIPIDEGTCQGGGGYSSGHD